MAPCLPCLSIGRVFRVRRKSIQRRAGRELQYRNQCAAVCFAFQCLDIAAAGEVFPAMFFNQLMHVASIFRHPAIVGHGNVCNQINTHGFAPILWPVG